MDTFILLIVIVVIGGVILKKSKPDTYNSIKNKVTSLINEQKINDALTVLDSCKKKISNLIQNIN